MLKTETFLNIDDINEANKTKLLQMREVLFASVVRNSNQEERKGMYIISLIIFNEFERLTSHITGPEINKN
jgi:hypothetical protein